MEEWQINIHIVAVIFVSFPVLSILCAVFNHNDDTDNNSRSGEEDSTPNSHNQACN